MEPTYVSIELVPVKFNIMNFLSVLKKLLLASATVTMLCKVYLSYNFMQRFASLNVMSPRSNVAVARQVLITSAKVTTSTTKAKLAPKRYVKHLGSEKKSQLYKVQYRVNKKG